MVLGIELDTVSQKLRIDPTRLAEIIIGDLMLDVLLQCSPSDPIIFDGITPSTRAPFGGEISSHPRRVIASSMTTNGPPHHILIFTPTHASLASVPISQATGSTGHSQTTTSPVPFGYVQGTLCHYRCRLHLGSILCLS